MLPFAPFWNVAVSPDRLILDQLGTDSAACYEA